jgi:hypothetical protein
MAIPGGRLLAVLEHIFVRKQMHKQNKPSKKWSRVR